MERVRGTEEDRQHMSFGGVSGMGTDVRVKRATTLLQRSWPGATVLRPADIGLGSGQSAAADFVAIIEALSDAGFLAYEALVLNADGPMVVDAALTARGRAALDACAELPH